MNRGVKFAFAWSALDQAGQYAVTFVLGILLARLLSPSEFGLTGMLAVFFAIADTFVNSGLGSALIQRMDLTEDDTTSSFCLNVTVAVAMAGLLCAISPWVAAFYQEPLLQPMLCVLSLRLIFGSLAIVQNSLRARDMDFKTLAIANWTASIGSGTVGVVLAWRGFGVWSLVSATVLRSLLVTMLLWWMRPWRPRGSFRWSSIQKLWSFSSRLLAAGLLDAIFRNASSVVIGKIYDAGALGLYTRARGFSDSASQTLSTVVGRVAFPYFSRLQTDRDVVKQRLRQFLRLTATFHFPFMIGLAAAAPAVVTALLTEKWAACVPLLQVLSLAGLLYPLHTYHLQILTALGRSDLYFRLEVIKKVLIAVNLVVTTPFGVFAMTCGMVVTSLIAYWINSFYTRRLLGYFWWEQVKDLLPMLSTAALTGGAGLVAGVAHFSNPWGLLAVQLAAILLTFTSLALFLRRSWFAEPMAALARFPWCPRWLVVAVVS